MALSEKRQQEILSLIGQGSGGVWLPGTGRKARARRGEAASSETAPGACRLLADLHQRRGTRLLRRELGAGRPGEADPRLIENPHVDAGTLLRLFWYSDPEFFYESARSAAEVADAGERDIFLTLETIERKITHSEYKTASIPFDPRRHVTMANSGEELARPIPAVMYKPITG